MPRSRNATVAASPAAAAETVIATLTNLTIPVDDVVDLEAWADLTIGTAGVSVVLRIRRGTTTGGALVVASSAITVVAANHASLNINGSDGQPVEQQNAAYCLTAQVASASAQTTVNAVYLGALY